MRGHHSPYYDCDAISGDATAGRHREIVGGLWEEIGSLQLGFLRARGLLTSSRLLDIGCGSLRLGAKAAAFLEAGHYWGTDLNSSLLDAGYTREIVPAALVGKLPRENLVTDSRFSFADVPNDFDFAIAQSVFTHLPLNHLRTCLINLAKHVRGDCTFYATFFLVQSNRLAEPFHHEPGGAVTYPDRDPYHYTLADIFYAASATPWRVEYIGDWNHPRAQQMVAFRI